MPVKKAAWKALRQSRKRHAVNSVAKRGLKKTVKLTKKTIADDRAQAATALRVALKAIDKAAQHGLMKKNTAARKKSRLAKHFNSVVAKSAT